MLIISKCLAYVLPQHYLTFLKQAMSLEIRPLVALLYGQYQLEFYGLYNALALLKYK
jgi:hypothetical protein